jgi:hypothetical protein
MTCGDAGLVIYFADSQNEGADYEMAILLKTIPKRKRRPV